MVDWVLGSANFSFDRFGSFGMDRVGITGRLSIKPHESGVLSVQDRGIFFPFGHTSGCELAFACFCWILMA